MDLAQNLHLNREYRIRKEGFGGLLFNKEDFSTMRISEFVYTILREIAIKNPNINKLILIFCKNANQRDILLRLVDHLIQCNIVGFGNTSLAIRQVFEGQTKKDLLSAPIYVWWDITSKCCLKCKYCYSNSGESSCNDLGTVEVFRILEQLSSAGVFYVFFLGGEPFARCDFIDILKYANNLGLGIMITTNGFLINESTVRDLEIIDPSFIRVSIDGSTAETHDAIRGVSGSYIKAIRAFNLLKASTLRSVGVSPTICKLNFNEIENIIDFAISNDCSEIQLTPTCFVGRAEKFPEIMLSNEEIIDFYRRVELCKGSAKNTIIDTPESDFHLKFNSELVYYHNIKPDLMGCASGYTCLSIYNNGDVGYCLMYRDVIDSLCDHEFIDIWHNCDKLMERRQKLESCKECKNLTFCTGGCLLSNHAEISTRSWPETEKVAIENTTMLKKI